MREPTGLALELVASTAWHRAFRLAAEVPRSGRWRVCARGLRLMSATVQPREVDYPQLHRRGPVTQAA